MRQGVVSPGQDAQGAVTRNAGGVALRNAAVDEAMLQELTQRLLPLLAKRIPHRHEPSRGALTGPCSDGERTSELTGALPEQQTQRASPPVFAVQEVPTVVGSFDVERFYSDVLDAIGSHALNGGTAFGAAAVVKRVAREYGLAVAERMPLPRPTRAERDDLAWERGKRGRK